MVRDYLSYVGCTVWLLVDPSLGLRGGFDPEPFDHFLQPEPREPQDLGGPRLVAARLEQGRLNQLGLERVDPGPHPQPNRLGGFIFDGSSDFFR